MDKPTIDTGQAISYGWTSVKKDFMYLVGISIVSSIIGSLTSSSDKGANNWDILGIFLSVWMTCGTMTMMLNYQAGKKLPFNDLFTQFKHFWSVLAATILLGFIVGLGFVFLIIPGIYLWLRFQFTIPLILDKNLGVIDAMNASSKMTQGIKMSLLGFNLTLFGVILLGLLALVVGVLVALPVVWLASVVVYRKLAAAQPTTPTPAPTTA